MRQIVVARPFAGGYRSDVPSYALDSNECAYSQDLIYPNGIAQQRYGWLFDGTTADVAANLVGVSRSRYPSVGSTITTTSDTAGNVYIHNASASGTAVWTNPTSAGTTWIPRCMYNGETIYCAQDGVTPLLRYAGSPYSYSAAWPSGGSGNWNFPAGTSEARGAGGIPASFPTDVGRGSFLTAQFVTAAGTASAYPFICCSVLSRNSSSSVTLDSVRNATASSPPASSASTVFITPFGVAWPGVSVWDTGTAVSNSGTVWSFSGADLSASGVTTSDALGYLIADSLLVVNPTPGSAHFCGTISTASLATSPQTLSTYGAPSSSITNATYRIARRLPFKDATVHKNSLWGTGVKQYPNRVYVGPPLWNIGLPPGAVEPFDPTVNDQFADLDEFLVQPIDVPSRYDTDPVTAVLSTPGPLLVLKGASVYGIFGAYPSYEQTLLANGSGCIDLRSAFTVDGVAYWAGRDGIFTYAGSQIINLTQGRVQREWQALMRGYVDGTSYVSAAVVSGHLVVSAGGLDGAATGSAKTGPDASAPTQRTFIYDLNAKLWASRLSNMDARNMATVRVPGEVNSIFAVSDDHQGRVIDLTPAVTGTKCTDRVAQTLAAAAPVDDAGTGPRMQAWTSSSLAAANGVDGEARFADLAVTTNLVDSAGTPTAAIDVSTSHGGGLDDQASTVVAQGTITGDSVDRVDRKKFRVNQTGRLHQVRIDMDVTPTTTTKTQIPEITATFRDSRRMT